MRATTSGTSARCLVGLPQQGGAAVQEHRACGTAQAAATARGDGAGHSLRIPPGNHLEALKDDRKGQHSIRINDQWRVCFVWKSDGAHQVEIVDYH